MISFKNVYSETERAFKNNEFYELLTGKKGYQLPILDVPVDIPTDWTIIVPCGIYELYRKTQNDKVKNDYQCALEKMMQGSPDEIWMVCNILFGQLKNQKLGKSPFVIDETILRDFNVAIKNNRKKLESDINWGGNDYPNGLMGDIERLNSILKRKYSISMVI